MIINNTSLHISNGKYCSYQKLRFRGYKFNKMRLLRPGPRWELTTLLRPLIG